MPRTRHPITGCNPDQLFGTWAILREPFDEMQARALAEIEAGRLAEVADASRKEREDNEPPLYTVADGIAHIPIEGPMTKKETSFSSMFGGTSTVRTIDALRKAAKDTDVEAMMLDVNSPGGTVLGTAELSDAVAKVDKIKPVYAHVAGQGTSAAFWAILPARRIYADPTAEVGSIGAFTVLTDRSENLKRQGIVKHRVASGELKGAGADGIAITPEHLAAFQKRMDDTAEPFIEAVARHRGYTLADAHKIADGGRVYGAAEALKLGLIDEIAFADDAANAVRLRPARERRQPDKGGSGLDEYLPAAKEDSTMSFSEQQLQRIRSLPGGKDVAEASAADFLLGLAADAGAQQQAARKAQDELVTVRQQLAEAQAKAPKGIDAEVAKGRVELAMERIQLSSEAGFCTPAQVEAVKAELAPEGKANLSAVLPDGRVVLSADTVNKAFKLHKVQDLGEKTGRQRLALERPAPTGSPLDDHEQDAKALAEEGRKEGEAWKQQQLAARGLK